MYKDMKPATYLFIIAIFLMPTVLLHANISVAKLIFMLTVYVFLYAVWSGARSIDKRNNAFSASLSVEQNNEFNKIRLQFGTLSVIAIGAIMFALAAGKLMATKH